MFDLSWIADLDAGGACRAVEASQVELRERELRELALAARWAVLHGPETLLARYHRPPVGPGGPRGGERCRRLGGDGTPEVTEFACAELAVVMGIGPAAVSSLMGDALDLRHRHLVMWAALVAGGGRVWKARQVVRRVHAAGLCVADARAVDARTTPSVDSLSWASVLRLVDAEIIAVDPAAAQERRRARELEQFVSAGQSDEHGLTTLIARAEAGEVIVFLAMVSRIADILQLEGDTAPVGCRRARAIGVLAQPAWALRLLQNWAALPLHPGYHTSSPTDGAAPTPADDPTSDHGQVVEETVSGTEPEPTLRLSPTPRPEEGCCPTCGEDIPAWAYEQAPRRTTAQPFPVDPDRVRPKAVLHLRMAAEALRAGTGVAVLVNQGASPITVDEAIRLLGH